MSTTNFLLLQLRSINFIVTKSFHSSSSNSTSTVPNMSTVNFLPTPLLSSQTICTSFGKISLGHSITRLFLHDTMAKSSRNNFQIYSFAVISLAIINFQNFAPLIKVSLLYYTPAIIALSCGFAMMQQIVNVQKIHACTKQATQNECIYGSTNKYCSLEPDRTH